MAKCTLLVKDSTFRFVIPASLRKVENIEVGDTIEFSIKKVMTESAKTQAFRARFDQALSERLSLLAPGALQELRAKVEEDK